MVSNKENFFGQLASIDESLPTHLKPIGQAFLQNLKGVVSTLAVPAAIAIAAINRQRFHQLHLTEIFREKANMLETEEDTCDSRGGELTEPQKSRVLSRARDAMDKEMESPEASNAFKASFFDFLNGVARSGFANVEEAALELLRQGMVLVWGSFEVLCRDLFVAHVNMKPKDVLKLLAEPNTKRRLQLRGLDFETLAQNDFNVADKIGTIIAMDQDLSRLVVLKDIFTALFPERDILRKSLSDKDLWLLNQRRHLIVHQRAIVDQQYIASTGDSLPLGKRLRPTPNEIDASLRLVSDTGLVVLKEVAGSI
jgi:hypothetical protein